MWIGVGVGVGVGIGDGGKYGVVGIVMRFLAPLRAWFERLYVMCRIYMDWKMGIERDFALGMGGYRS